MKKLFSIILSILSLFIFTACSNVHYIRTEKGAEFTLERLYWTYSIEFERENSNETYLIYEATLTEGEINVYYDRGLFWGKEFLFNVKAGETISSEGGYIEGDVDIIIQPVSPASGMMYIQFGN